MEKENTKEDLKKDGLTAVSENQAYAKNKPIVNNSTTAPTSGSSGTVPPPTLSKPIISSNSTPITSGISTPTSEGVFKIPKKIVLTSTANGSNAILNPNNSGSLKLNKNAIGNLNQSLMAKQKIINKNEPLPKSHSSILDSIATSPRTTSFPSSVSGTPAEEIRNPISSSSPTSLASGAAHPPITSVEGAVASGSSTNTPVPTPSTIQSTSEEISEASTPRPSKSEKTKKSNNQVSTRTDFFAAKLASAVDDVDSSDSDETFVYENNAPGYDTQSISNHSNHEGGSNNNNNTNSNISTAAVGSPNLENKSNNGSMMNAPGVVAPAGMSLSSPPILDQSYEDTHNNTINSISTIQTELPPTDSTTTTSANNNKNSTNANHTNTSHDDALNNSQTTTSQITDKVEIAEAPESDIHDVNASNAPNSDKKPHNNSTNSSANPQPNPTPTANNKDAEHLHQPFSGYMDINSSNTSTPLMAGKTDSIQSLRSIKFPKANSNQNSKAPVNNNEPNVNTITSNKEVTTISGKERPQTQRSNSMYSMSHPSLKGVTTATITTNYNGTKNNSGHVDEDVHGIQVSPNGSTILGTVNSNSFNDGQGGSGTGIGLFDGRSSYQPSRAGTSINETYTNEDRYSSDDMDEDAEVIEDGGSNSGEFYANEADSTLNGNMDVGLGPGTGISLATMSQRPPLVSPNGGIEGNDSPLFEQITHNNVSNSNFGGISQGGTNSVVSKLGGEVGGKRNKSSTTSSRLRSTTSKLFDKKGSQPRRYSIIPDDIDIEDFDDELIYYDNNIRFPYSNNSINGNSAINNNNQFNENSSLLDGGVGGIPGRIPHYRSLNLNPANNGGKKVSNYKNKRYLSSGQQFLSNNNSGSNTPPNELPNANAVNKDMFPFPYGEANQPYYYDFDEYDEAGSHSDSVDNNNFNKFGRKGSRNFSGYSGNGGHPQLSASNGHFFLPRKRSSNFKNQRGSCVRSFLYTLISILAILSVGFILGFILATTKELTHVSVLSIDNTLVSQDELVFNIVIEAFNPGWFSVEIQEVELDIFAKSGYLPDPDDGDNPGDGDGEESDVDATNSVNTLANIGDNPELGIRSVETVLLGSIFNLETPMYFRGGFVNRSPIKQVAEVKLVKPGSNLSTLFENDSNKTEPELPDNSKKWEIISKNPFDIIVRGLLKYKLPLTKNLRSVVVKKTSYVDPNDS
ncbi:hypothetical protein CLIB1423_01S04874 [[Candida] railenensis]|uniref:Vacuolar segregation protein 7 n=1 Tax=[Candida] railenensis TaxID=45579 RepID=A0A9P0VVL9_9ASCO|nr:hypothetical protein CLIB1423_01S04874 [[Candida] railenensis]